MAEDHNLKRHDVEPQEMSENILGKHLNRTPESRSRDVR